jgi:hypothetical protein
MPDPSSFILPLLLQSALIPFAVALALLFALRRSLPAQASALAVAAAFIASYFAIFHAQWSLVPQQALDWLPWLALFGTAAAIGAETVSTSGRQWLARTLIAAAAAGIVVWPALASTGWQKGALTIVVAAVLIGAAWTYLARIGQGRPTPSLLLTVVAGGSALALMLDSSQAIGQLSGALASALAACVVFNLPRVRSVFSGAASGVAVLLVGVLLLNAYLYAGFSLVYVALLVAGLLADPLVAAINRLRQRNDGIAAWLSAGVLCAVPVMVTIGLVIKAAQEAGGY